MAGIERIHIKSSWSDSEKRCKQSHNLEMTADEIYQNIFSSMNMELDDGVIIHDCTKDDAISMYDWKDGIDLFLHTKSGHTLTVQEKLLTKRYKTITFTECQKNGLPGNWYTSVSHYWFVGYAYYYPNSVEFNHWMLIDLPCLKRLDHKSNLGWVIQDNTENGYRGIKFRYLDFDNVPNDAVIARY